MKALEIENLCKNFGGVQALHDVCLSIENGKKLAIIGPNGAGKTTLLNVLNGLLPATRGRIYLFGRDIGQMSIDQRAHFGLSRSFQLTRLFFDLTVLDNIMLAIQGTQLCRYGCFRPMTGYEHLLVKAQELLEVIDLWEKRDYIVKNISYGEQRKMEIAFSIASEPKLLLLDEPGSGLTINERSAIVEMIRNLGADITAIIVDHNMDLVFSISDHIVMLHYGKIIAEGTPDEIRADSMVREIYLGPDKDLRNVRIS